MLCQGLPLGAEFQEQQYLTNEIGNSYIDRSRDMLACQKRTRKQCENNRKGRDGWNIDYRIRNKRIV